MNGLKRVRSRYDDALAQVDWQQLEVLLAVYYRGQGYAVEHVGTGATGAGTDGGIDLKLRRDHEYVLVQVKHWNACQVPHNDVHQLLGIMVNESATGAVLITSGEFTRAAVEAAARQGHVQLIDGAELRTMLGPLPSTTRARVPVATRGSSPAGRSSAGARRGDAYGAANAFARAAGERLLDAAEDRIRNGGRRRLRRAVEMSLGVVLFKMAVAAVMFGALWLAIRVALDSLQTALVAAPRPVPAAFAPDLPAQAGAPQLRSEAAAMPAAEVPRRGEPSPAEIRESQRRADEAMRILEASTPEM